MTRKTDSKTVLFASASALAIGLFGQTAWAQDSDAPESTRTLATVTVTTQKTEQSVQDVPIAVSAFDEDAINRLQLTGGADLVKAVPNVSFTKGQFTGSNFKIRGIGNDAVAQSSDAGVGIHQNDVPLGANFLYEQEYFDIERVEVLRGPQGTLYGRNSTGGVVNIITRKPVFGEFQANAALTYGNYNTIKGQGMVNVPVGEKVALRVAGAITSRDGYTDNTVTGNDVNGRELWSVRATLGFEPSDNFRGWLSYEHFDEDDDRIRSGKQLCKKDPTKTSFAGIPITGLDTLITSLGCQDAPFSDSYDRVNSAGTLGGGLGIVAGLLNGDAYNTPLDPNLRNIESALDPVYKAQQDLYTLKLELDIGESLKLTSLTSRNETDQVSVDDYNKIAPTIAFNTTAGPFFLAPGAEAVYDLLFPGGVVSDPQLGVSNLFRSFDISGGATETTTQEFRLQSDYEGPFNFNLGMIYVDGEAIDPQDNQAGYYVLSNTLSALTQLNNALGGAIFGGLTPLDTSNPDDDGNVLNSLEGFGRNYFRSLSPYRLKSKAFFGEGYYDVTDELKFTLGLRYTNDEKEQDIVPSALFAPVAALPEAGVPIGLLEADFQETTGRIGLDWSPTLNATDDTLVYAFYSKGYKGGGLNPPQPAGANLFPQTFEPEFIDAFELGTKNTFANNTQSLNVTGFYYDYQGYQITQIVNRTSANFNVDAKISGLEVEYLWTPADNWLLTANLGLLKSELQGTTGIDVLDRTNGDPNFVTLKNASTYSNCVVSAQGYATVLGAIQGGLLNNGDSRGLCSGAFAGSEAAFGLGNVTYVDGNGVTQTIGALTPFDGISKDLDGNKLPGAPEMTLNLAAEYTFNSLNNSGWDMTVRGDFYYQDDSYSRVFNSQHDELDSWTNLNLSLVLANEESGWGVEAFAKNVTDEEVITGTYLTDDSSGLYSNIFLTEPALYGITVRKSW
ncbi:MAG: TonB-dependent receptor [Hyphomonas sp. BRH_c22]|uniref:TonB-dependent receptor n=1 Tax=Hyphomonas sp. BRH_c22 TaxID=1629710 RepID=UPI0005F21649|nr:TonB-dependent receptor [Hyphomonas sp. BRH_c22]KJS38174.1 MAG: TonB-dependent receptor [Hyphomonas sp. BRH_c22]|tara:strand:- start:4421 stop:7288 length:2868 start_codon:yes stop_codon:yes gene_type:complete